MIEILPIYYYDAIDRTTCRMATIARVRISSLVFYAHDFNLIFSISINPTPEPIISAGSPPPFP